LESDPFRIRAHVADFEDILGDMLERSEAARARLPMQADIAYGADATETVDLFVPENRGQGLPVHMFIHGGYWRAFSRRDHSYVADTITAAGAIAVIVDYALMPKVRMGHIVDQVRRAKHWVLDHIAEHGGDPSRLTVSGHSAGAHLSTFLFNEAETPSRLRAALLLGGLYDVKPLQSSFLQAEISITDDEVAHFSPLTHRHDPTVAVDLVVGADETPPFREQANQFASELRAQGLVVTQFEVPGQNHQSSVRDLGIAGTQTGRRLAQLIATH
jgi:arylformamidase